jgi:hypothetical protein
VPLRRRKNRSVTAKPGTSHPDHLFLPFEVIHELMTPTEPRKKRPIGFAPWLKK